MGEIFVHVLGEILKGLFQFLLNAPENRTTNASEYKPSGSYI
jgi:hypothetical protein